MTPPSRQKHPHLRKLLSSSIANSIIESVLNIGIDNRYSYINNILTIKEKQENDHTPVLIHCEHRTWGFIKGAFIVGLLDCIQIYRHFFHGVDKNGKLPVANPHFCF